MPAKIITLSQKDQNVLRAALERALEWEPLVHHICPTTPEEDVITERIRELKERLV